MDMLSFMLGKALGGSGGGGSSVEVEALTATENKKYTAPTGKAYSPVTVNVPIPVGGLEYETGTWTPTADTNHGSIPFTNQHTKAPAFFAVLDTSDRSTLSEATVYGCFYCDTYKLFGIGWPWGNTGTSNRYTAIQTLYINNGATQYQGSSTGKNSDDTGDSTANYPRYWAKETGIYPYAGNDARYYRANHTFKWIAIWMPES